MEEALAFSPSREDANSRSPHEGIRRKIGFELGEGRSNRYF
jgi:hypothetical protein